ncbi:MAG: hypothetical protein NT166_08600 [Candidatus Aminicenantes bacterium]|nr:hypothetical protein [Candidatus Aminicenantes bacterium]
MKKITVFVLTMVLCLGISTAAFAVDGNEMVTPYEKQLALKDPQVKAVIEKSQQVVREVFKKVAKEVAKEAVKEAVKEGVKALIKAAI